MPSTRPPTGRGLLGPIFVEQRPIFHYLAFLSARYTVDRKLGRTGDPVLELGAALAERRTTERQELVLGWLGQASPMFGEALALWRMAEERVRPDLEREDGFRDRDFTRFVQV